MRLRNVKNKKDIMEESSFLVKDASSYKGKWNEYFSNTNPIYVEIGTGKGQFLIKNAILHPEINFIGIEKYDSVIVRALQKIPQELTNICMIRLDALNLLDIFDHDIDRIYLNFSDPWPKNRHHERRLSSETFLTKYDYIFRNEKRIEMRTDNMDLFEYSLIHFNNHGYLFQKVSLDFHREEVPLVTSEYEDKFSAQGIPIYYIECFKP